MATWFELLGGIALVIGLGTRFFSVSLLVLSVVAMSIVLHGLTSQPLLDYYERLKRRT